ncbi:hypothetical protein A6U87_16600 [Rhizobium sp. AC44/96]|uniref:bifunctional glycosyltransferase family 2/GtrA family protein n=1 Tax=Rhizobium sp. AC44/96 TaxID=1841654 RepID=UPI00081007A8|nr:bifunctional glycosyltransferase family 2/GtrA family protein [Rhizobium sp. AC44/96]OCJ04451.1 hypothetical protein A6U87_16600 [Rhizobium sp. AC44/96]
MDQITQLTSEPWVLIPAYQPTETLVDLVESIKRDTNFPVLVVNDGSAERCRSIFETLEKKPGVVVIHHAVNRGKGQALKTGINHFLVVSSSSCPGIVTADADGQHLPSDILRVGLEGKTGSDLILGSRTFADGVPLRSRFGNLLTMGVFRAVVGQKITDTQTGLRYLPRAMLPKFLRIPYGGYDYELAMLVETVKSGANIREVPIETVYIDNNSSSHFNPLKDSLRIYFVFVRFAGVSIATAVLDFAVFAAAFSLLGNIFWSIFASRLVAGTFNFAASKRVVFKSETSVAPELGKYVALVVLLMVLSWLSTEALSGLMNGHVLIAKALAEGALFLASFAVQRTFVFGANRG